MTDASNFMDVAAPPIPDRPADTRLPRIRPFDAPVLMADAITPLAGETVLSLLWKRLESSADDDL